MCPASNRSRRPDPPPTDTVARGLARAGAVLLHAVPRLVRAVPRLVRRLRNAPNPRLTGIGSGLFCAATMFLLACLDRVLLDGSLMVYGALFLPVSALTALWVRRADLLTAPVAVPIGFALGALPIVGDADGGVTSRLMGLFTALAMYAGWLYGGTLIAGVITTARKLRLIWLMNRRAAAQGRNVPAAGFRGTATGRSGYSAAPGVSAPGRAGRVAPGPRSAAGPGGGAGAGTASRTGGGRFSGGKGKGTGGSGSGGSAAGAPRRRLRPPHPGEGPPRPRRRPA
ncbi:DUF6542 domain-containing protein [Streptomyces sp. TS71-3]|uniref:DUF6542 domain-containing protein n=1 Tax=Streptomyces sp. TS71-3 TaxID=2733862 RepID=UPI0027E24F85|nr:DUF6542 domain-containing protein [Streptomyces sp. TS71-3]